MAGWRRVVPEGGGVEARGLVGCIVRLGLVLWWSFWLLVLEGTEEVELFDE